MYNQNRLQFAITREDPSLEANLISHCQAKEALLVCSGGDTVLALNSVFPELKITAFDFNPFQIEHLKKKSRSTGTALNSESARGLCQSGNFESLFRQWRLFMNEFIVSAEQTKQMFTNSAPFNQEIFTSPYWKVSFDLHFHDSILLAMFGEAAIQHAPRGSYPRYFQQAFERGLLRPDFKTNPFLQHLLLGEYLDLPDYLARPNDLSQVELIIGTLLDVPKLERFDFIQLSNIFDWSSLEEIKQTCNHLADKMKPGATVFIRQINNDSPISDYLGPRFELDNKKAKLMLNTDRSLFYSNFIIARKRD